MSTTRGPLRTGSAGGAIAALALLFSLAACTGGPPQPPPTTGSAGPTETASPPGSTPGESPPATTPGSTPDMTPPATASPPPETPCPDAGGTDRVEDGFPQRLSTVVGAEIRTGAHEPCFERVVIEFSGSGTLPGYRVEYRDDPILDAPRGEPVDVAGDATLVVSAGAWMPGPDGAGYDGPAQLHPDNVSVIQELERIENFESQTSWAIGLDRERDFTVTTLEDPMRLVVDISLD
ncbi:hypothetical protein ASD19_05585 [Microbacterium sp. Root53]|uniref:AMIN-like domain-containing (lipo)protein n=1 Tax=Microbacterium sp. Root53 TaxID=1736553 RepID=UPI0006F29388|nr:hypothetical protein [Microbacterium sp. Root53]KQY98697.1 hypothetical protein ASD19_05585 [Microbacterium sp. Root53]